MKSNLCYLTVFSILTTSCATMNESLQLGAGMGALTGGAATYVGASTSNGKAKLGDVALGAGIGLGIGLITSYFTHKSVEDKRASLQSDQTELNFGDLPPSPFIVPNPKLNKGGK